MVKPIIHAIRSSPEYSLSALIDVLLIGISFGLYYLLPPQIPLWYSLSVQEQQLAPKVFIFTIPLVLGFVLILHTLLVYLLGFLDGTFRKMIAMSTLFITVLGTIAFVRIAIIIL